MTDTITQATDTIHETVRERYAQAAISALSGVSSSCGEACCTEASAIGPGLYSALERQELPDAAVLASLGCGNPIAVAELHEGERVLDLGSGGGIDVLLSARRVGPTGRAFGLDMTDEMLELANRNAAEVRATNVEFLKGHIEAIPLPANSIDVVISNCVINLAADKPAVFAEIARVLRPRGALVLMWNVPAGPTEPSIAAVEQFLAERRPKQDGLAYPLDLRGPHYATGEWRLAFAANDANSARPLRIRRCRRIAAKLQSARWL